MDTFAFMNRKLIYCCYIESMPWPMDFAVRAVLVEATRMNGGLFSPSLGLWPPSSAHSSSYRTVSYLRVEMYQLASGLTP